MGIVGKLRSLITGTPTPTSPKAMPSGQPIGVSRSGTSPAHQVPSEANMLEQGWRLGDWFTPDCLVSIANAEGGWDIARERMQKVAYEITRPEYPASQQEWFRSFASGVVANDPLYQSTIRKVKAAIAAHPGVMQSEIYKGRSEQEKEGARDVLYFAEALGAIYREKSGRSYRLYLSAPANSGHVALSKADTSTTASESAKPEDFYGPAFDRIAADIEWSDAARGQVWATLQPLIGQAPSIAQKSLMPVWPEHFSWPAGEEALSKASQPVSAKGFAKLLSIETSKLAYNLYRVQQIRELYEDPALVKTRNTVMIEHQCAEHDVPENLVLMSAEEFQSATVEPCRVIGCQWDISTLNQRGLAKRGLTAP